MNPQQLQSEIKDTGEGVDQMQVELGHLPTPGEGSTPNTPDPEAVRSGKGVPLKTDKAVTLATPTGIAPPNFGRTASMGSLVDVFNKGQSSLFGAQFNKLAQRVKRIEPKSYSVRVKNDGSGMDRRCLKDTVKGIFNSKKKKKTPTLLENVRAKKR